MSYLKKIEKGHVLRDEVRFFPRYELFVFEGEISINGEDSSKDSPISPGSIDLLEQNVGRGTAPLTDLIYPFVYKGADKTLPVNSTYGNYLNFSNGDQIIGEYPLEIKIEILRSDLASLSSYATPLNRISSYYNMLSWNFETLDLNSIDSTIVKIPREIAGSKIQRGSVRAYCYHLNQEISSLSDEDSQNGILRDSSGEIAAYVYYDHGFIVFVGDSVLSAHQEDFWDVNDNPRWKYFGNDNIVHSGEEVTWRLEFKGTVRVNVLTVFCRAREGEFNLSNNRTSRKPLESIFSAQGYTENSKKQIYNVKKPDTNKDETFEKNVYLTGASLYSKDGEKVAVAKLSSPVRKREQDDITIKLRLDI